MEPIPKTYNFKKQTSFIRVFITTPLLSRLSLTWWQPCKFESLPYDEYEPLSVLPVNKKKKKKDV